MAYGEHVVITSIATQYLSRDEEEVVQEYILNNQTNSARLCLLGKVDLLWDNEKIHNYEILRIYHALGVKPKECFLKAKR